MKDLSQVKKDQKGYYIIYTVQDGKLKGKTQRRYGKIIKCTNCDDPFFIRSFFLKERKNRFCSRSCRRGKYSPVYGRHHSEETLKKFRNRKVLKGKEHPNWKGEWKTTSGYIVVKKPEHPYCSKQGYIMKHRLIIEEKIGRYLKSNELIHHKNGMRDDNRPENLEIIIKKAHHNFHNSKIKCPYCQREFGIQ